MNGIGLLSEKNREEKVLRFLRV